MSKSVVLIQKFDAVHVHVQEAYHMRCVLCIFLSRLMKIAIAIQEGGICMSAHKGLSSFSFLQIIQDWHTG